MGNDRRLALGFLLPGLLLVTGFIIVPIALAIQLSMYKLESFLSTPTFTGVANFVSLAQDSRFWNALWNGTVYTVLCIVLQTGLGIALALVLNEQFPGRAFVRGAVLVPYILPTVVVALVWRWMLDANLGIVTSWLRWIGFQPAWTDDPRMAMTLVVIASVWAWTPFVTVSFLAGLQTIPTALYESAEVDGAGTIQQFFRITLPVLKPVLAVIVLLRGIWMFNKFDIVWLLTGGGPLQATEHLPILAYVKTFGLFDVGGGTAVATASFVILAVFIVIYFRAFPLEERR
jgi:multiple sugar transport system permease protein